jgi:nucleoside-diphosphate-sugar epimerase
MRVLVTGAFGNIGASAVRELLRQGHQVRCFARDTGANRRAATKLSGDLARLGAMGLSGADAAIAWGDMRRPEDLQRAVAGQEVILHLAYVLPPASEDHPEAVYEINVRGTRRLLEAARAQPQPPRFLFASSFDVFGHTQDQPPPRRVDDPVHATDAYSTHKLACEELVRTSGLDWAIFRFADVPPLAARRPHPIMFRIPLDTRFEVLHTADAGLALANALSCPEVWGKVTLIGGGPTCQVRYRDYLGRMLDVMGIGPLPVNAFGSEPYCTDWLDTSESQRLLCYQRHSFEEVVGDVARALGPRRHLIAPVRRLARWWILRMSPYYPRQLDVPPT